ncbi:MAG: tRNA (adenosine(37)-N6)-threonylcarbamoyltransferase complex dimerization subunit type 1 TsaB [Chromatiales bacterium]|nr:tRNA (adenosine(37)-N6)-threonylcarbamoyltransferase complex dimerization subunit type 1 TsaB [Chromatiales bacterium]
MRLLAIETATDACSAALWMDDALAAERFELAPRGHTRLLLPMIEALLGAAGMRAAELDAVAFGRGPGAFTGLRIAAAVAQGLAFANARPVVPVSTLAALAQPALDAGAATVLCALDARMGQVYWGAFGRDASGLARAVVDEQVCDPDRVEMPPDAMGPAVGVGSGFTVYRGLLSERCGLDDAVIDSQALPRAAAIARLAAAQLRRTGGVSVEEALPVYLRDQVATPKPQ